MTSPAKKYLQWTPPEIMLAILFLLAPLYYHPNLGGEGLRIPHNITIWLVATIFIAYSFHKIFKARQYAIPKYFWMIAAFPVLATLSGFIAGVEQPLKWLFRLLFIWGGLAFFFALFQAKLSQARIDRLFYLVVLSALIFAIVGIMQIWLKLDMPYLLPKNPDGIPSSFFQQINNQATYQVTAIFIAIYLSMRPWLRSGHTIKRITLLIAVLLAAYIVAISGSRIGALTLIISMLVVLPVIWRNWRRHRLVLGVLSAVVIGIFSGNLTGSDKLVNKTEAIQSGYSAEARLGMYSISLDLIAESPIVGHGIGSFGPKWQYAKPDFYAEYPDAKLPNEMVGHPHNELIQWLVEGGLLAFAGMVLVVIGVVLAGIKTSANRASLYATMLIPIALHTQVELPFYMSALHWLVFMWLLFVVLQHQTRQKTMGLTVSATNLLKLSSISGAIILVVFYAHSIRSNWDFVAYYQGKQMQNPLPYAYQNPYLGEQARWIDLSAMMYSSIEQDIPENVRYYIVWGEAYKKYRPDVDLYIKLVDAYEFIGDRANYCSSANEGLNIYPANGRLLNAVEFCKY